MQGCDCDVLAKTECLMEEECMDLIIEALKKGASYVAVNCSSYGSFYHCCVLIVL